MPVLLAKQSGNTTNNGLGSRVGKWGGSEGQGLVSPCACFALAFLPKLFVCVFALCLF